MNCVLCNAPWIVNDSAFMNVRRFYIMHIKDRPLKFSVITHHASVTQCLGSIGGHVWYLGVAKPSIMGPDESKGAAGMNVAKSPCGHFYVPPSVEDVRVFRISGPKFLKLNRGTWHAGPLFKAGTMDFYNLELSNTNVSFSLPLSPLFPNFKILCSFAKIWWNLFLSLLNASSTPMTY